MSQSTDARAQDLTSSVGSVDLALPSELRAPLRAHLEDLRQKYLQRGWGARIGLGKSPAVAVIDLALFWTRPEHQIGSNAEPIIENTCRVLAAAREANVPVFFTTFDYDPAHPPSPHDAKLQLQLSPDMLIVTGMSTSNSACASCRSRLAEPTNPTTSVGSRWSRNSLMLGQDGRATSWPARQGGRVGHFLQDTSIRRALLLLFSNRCDHRT